MAKNNQYGNPLSMGVGIAQQDLQNQVGIRNEYDDDADLFRSLGEIAGPKPRGAAALFSGLAKGAEYGSRTKSTAKKQDALSKHERVMGYLRETNNQMMEQRKWYETREFAQKKYLPQVLSYAQNVNTLDPQSRRMMLEDVLNGYNQTVGEDYKLASIDGSNPFIVTLQGKKGAQIVDIRNLFAGDENAQAMLNMQMPEYLKQQQEVRQDKERAFKLKQDDIDINKFEKGIPGGQYGTKQGNAASSENQTLDVNGLQYMVGDLSTLEKGARADYQKKVHAQLESIPKNNQALDAIETMEEVFDRNPNIGTSFINMLDNPDGQDSWMNIFGRKLAGQDLTDMEILKKATNDLNLDTILGITGKAATDLLKKAVQAASPSGKLTKGGFDNNAKKWKKKAHDNNRIIMAKYEAMQKGKSLTENPKGSPNIAKQGDGDDPWSNLGTVGQ